MKNIIDKKIKSREFTFMELLKLDALAVALANETYEELTTQQRMEFAWEVKITATGEAFGELFRKATIESLRNAFAIGLKTFMENAKVTSQSEESKTVTSFEAPSVEDIPSTPIETLQETTDKIVEVISEENKKTTTFETGTDGIDLPKGVKRYE